MLVMYVDNKEVQRSDERDCAEKGYAPEWMLRNRNDG